MVGANKKTPSIVRSRAFSIKKGPGDDRLSRCSTIMGPAGLTAVFGMGTGVAPRVWSPGNRGPEGFNSGPRVSGWAWSIHGLGFEILHADHDEPSDRENACCETRIVGSGGLGPPRSVFGGLIGVVKPLGC